MNAAVGLTGSFHLRPPQPLPPRATASPPPRAAATPWGQKGHWVLKILKVGSLWRNKQEKIPGEAIERNMVEEDEDAPSSSSDLCVFGCGFDEASSDHMDLDFDGDSFSKILKRVSLAESRLYAKMSYLGRLAYMIPKIQTENLLKRYGLRFVTSSLHNKERTLAYEMERGSDQATEEKNVPSEKDGRWVSLSSAYRAVAYAASYLQYQTKNILPLRSSEADMGIESPEHGVNNPHGGVDSHSNKAAYFVATTNAVTAVVAGKEEMKQAVATELSTGTSSPCEWFVCDDNRCATRYFVIQGSESLASWQANLLFEPIQFEELDILVHRGIYEIAKGIYKKILPEVRAYLQSHGSSATLRFTGHSLGGSLSMLLSLMLLIRHEVSISSLLPVVTFGAPSIMCGGDYLLHKLGLPRNHIQAIIMHRDIVPRAFSCSYPDRVIDILKAVSGKFRNHPCLLKQKLLYAPTGDLLILQPEETLSPHHDLLPRASGLFLLEESPSYSPSFLRSATSAFLNSPHPLEILSDLSAYGSEGQVFRHHDVHAYLKALQGIVRQELKLLRKAGGGRPRVRGWWSHTVGETPNFFSFVGVFNGGKEVLERVSRMAASRQIHMFVMFLLPVKILIFSAIFRHH